MKRIFFLTTLFLFTGKPVYSQNSPESAGFHSDKLFEVIELASSSSINVHSLHVSRNDKVFFELYSAPFSENTLHDVASVTKSIVALLIWKAYSDGVIEDLDTPFINYLPNEYVQSAPNSVKKITIQHLLDMRSGWSCGLENGEAELEEMRKAEDWIKKAISMEISSEPGNTFGYCSPNFHVLASILHYKTGNLIEYARTHFFIPLGIEDFSWSIDLQGIPHGWGDLALFPSDMIKIGQLLENKGVLGKNRILPKELISEIEHTIGSQRYRNGFWFTESEYEANGRGGQRITIIPSINAVVVFTGGGFEPGILGEKLGEAFSEQQEIEENPEEYQNLLRSIEKLKELPKFKSELTSYPFLDKIGLEFEYNDFGIKDLKLINSDSLLSMKLSLSDGTRVTHVFNKDGSISVNEKDKFRQAGRILESSNTHILFLLDTLSRINRYELLVSFEDDNMATMKINDLTNNSEYILQGKAIK